MRAKDAARVVNEDLILRMDGYSVSARVGKAGFLIDVPNEGIENYVTIRVRWRNIDTSYDVSNINPPDRFMRNMTVDATKLESREDVVHVVHEAMMRVFSHEAREGLRLKSEDLKAPFHPHRFDGVVAFGDLEGDTAFYNNIEREAVTPQMMRDSINGLQQAARERTYA